MKKLLEWDKNLWAKIGTLIMNKIMVRTDKGIGVKNGKEYRFGAYSDVYRKAKARGMTRITNRAGSKGTKYANLTGVSVNRQTEHVDFRLTGNTMGDLKPREITKQSVVIGWRGESAEVVAGNEDRGKYVVDDVSQKDINAILDIVLKKLDENLRKKVKNITLMVKA